MVLVGNPLEKSYQGGEDVQFIGSSMSISSLECVGCAAPLPRRPTTTVSVECEYCGKVNIYTPPTKEAAVAEAELDTSDQDLLMYQEATQILDEFGGEMVGGEVSKVRINLSGHNILIVLEDFPNSIFLDYPGSLREIIGEFHDLETIKLWDPGKSHTIAVFREIQEKLGDVQETQERILDTELQEILDNFDAVLSGSQIRVAFYNQSGDTMGAIVGVESRELHFDSSLQQHPSSAEILRDHQQGRISLMEALSQIEQAVLEV